MNLVLRDAYVEDCTRALRKWNMVLKKAKLPMPTHPEEQFNRQQGLYGGMSFDTHGKMISAEEGEERRAEFLPTTEDLEYVKF